MKLRNILLMLAFLSLISVSGGGYLYYLSIRASSLDKVHQDGMTRTQLIADHIDSYLSERQQTVKAFAGLKELRQALAGKDENTLTEANRILDDFQQALKVDVCYLMDEQGSTVASSNRTAPDSFVGKNYAFRPYFQEAIQGNPAIYMALGATSGKRGVYFSHPVFRDMHELPLGVLVVKDSNETTEHELSIEYQGVMLFTDPHGVIFASSREDWLFQVLWKIPLDETMKIAKTRQFGDGPLNWTGVNRLDENTAGDSSGIEYQIHQSDVKNYPGWKITYLHDSRALINRTSGALFKTAGLIILILCLTLGLAVLILYREAANVIVLRRKTEEALQKEKAFSDSLIRSLPGVFYLFDEKELRFHRWNHNFEEVTGYSSSEIAGMSPLALFDEKEGAEVAAAIAQVFEKGYATVEASLLTKKGDRIPYFFSGHILKTEGVTYLVGMGIDVSERKQADDVLKKSEMRFRNLIEGSIQGVLIHSHHKALFVNQAWASIHGYTPEEILKMDSVVSLMSPHDQERMVEYKKARLMGNSVPSSYDYQGVRKDGSLIWLENRVLRVEWNGKPAIQTIIVDISERKLLEKDRTTLIQELERLSTTDPLTGAYNRRYFNEAAGKLFKLSIRHNRSLSALMLDIDYFKKVNDTYGHDIGDEVLKKVAQTCQRMTRETDLCARYGGEEFCFLFPETGVREAHVIAEKLRAAIAELVMTAGRRKFSVTASFGVSEYRHNGDSLESLIKRSDEALYEAKRKGRNCAVSKC